MLLFTNHTRNAFFAVERDLNLIYSGQTNYIRG